MSAPTRTHPLLAGVVALEARIDELADPRSGADPDWLPTGEKAELLLALHRIETKAAALRLRAMTGAADVAEEAGAKDVGAWFAHAARLDSSRGGPDGKLARQLAERAGLAEALRRGEVTPDHARAALKAVEDLPADLDPEVRASVEVRMVEHACAFTPRQVARLGRRVFELVAPEVADAHEQRVLEAQEARAFETCRLDLVERGDGTTRMAVCCRPWPG